MGTKATAGTCTQGASFLGWKETFSYSFSAICCLSALLLPVSTRWSYSNTGLAAAPGEQYTTVYFISMTIFLKWVGFYEKSKFKNKPNRNCRSQMHILPGCVIKTVLQKLFPGDAGMCRAALRHAGAADGVCMQPHLSRRLVFPWLRKSPVPCVPGGHLAHGWLVSPSTPTSSWPQSQSAHHLGLHLPSSDDPFVLHFCSF